jgi:hypothetical protein
MAYKGKYKIKNREKYKGNADNIVYRSSWERTLMEWLDKNPNVIEWSSEELAIPYISPLDGEFHRYFPDIWCKCKKADGQVETIVIEVKPEKESPIDENGNPKDPPKRGKRLMRYYLKEVARWGVNDAKFQAAKAFCEDRGWKFQVLTEKELNSLK